MILTHNNIQQIDAEAFHRLKELEVLDLSHNHIDKLTGKEFKEIENVQNLFLDNNRLTHLSAEVMAKFPQLKHLTLHKNELTKLPKSVETAALEGVTLAENPWRCDCDNRFALQRWLPSNRATVSDADHIYCFENVTAVSVGRSFNDTSNEATILSSLPPNDRDTVKINFWAFRDQINQTFCQNGQSGFVTETGPQPGPMGKRDDVMLPVLLLALALLSALAICLCLCVVACRLCRRQSKRHKAPASLNSSHTTSTPIPLINYDVFIAYSADDQSEVHQVLAPQLQQQGIELCLLHRLASSFSIPTVC